MAFEVMNKSTDRPYGITRYKCNGYEFDIMHMDDPDVVANVPDSVLKYIESQFIVRED